MIIPDGSVYVGRAAHINMELSNYLTTDRTDFAFITTAVAARAGELHMKQSNPNAETPLRSLLGKAVHDWLVGSEPPHATLRHRQEAVVDALLVLDLSGNPTRLRNVHVVVIAGNSMRVVLGKIAARRLYTIHDG